MVIVIGALIALKKAVCSHAWKKCAFLLSVAVLISRYTYHVINVRLDLAEFELLSAFEHQFHFVILMFQLRSSRENNKAAGKCFCLKQSHPEIDKLRNEVKKDLVSLPMISALCNDKELLRSTNQCVCSQKPGSPRPISWHCESNPVFSFPTTDSAAVEACH